MKTVGRAPAALAMLLLVAAFSPTAHAAQKRGPDRFDQAVPQIRLIHQTIFQAFAELYESTGIVISVERTLGENGPVPDQKFTATIRGGKPAQVLNEICAIDPRYAWSRDGDTVNVYPWKTVGDRSYLFNRRIPIFHLDAVPQADSAVIRAVDELPGRRQQLIVLGTGGTDFSTPWTVTLKNMTLRLAANRIAQHLCSGCGWQLLPGKRSEPILVFYRKLQSSRPRDHHQQCRDISATR